MISNFERENIPDFSFVNLVTINFTEWVIKTNIHPQFLSLFHLYIHYNIKEYISPEIGIKFAIFILYNVWLSFQSVMFASHPVQIKSVIFLAIDY